MINKNCKIEKFENPFPYIKIQNFLEIYQEEVQTRRAIEYNRQKNSENGETGLDKLINVS